MKSFLGMFTYTNAVSIVSGSLTEYNNCVLLKKKSKFQEGTKFETITVDTINSMIHFWLGNSNDIVSTRGTFLENLIENLRISIIVAILIENHDYSTGMQFEYKGDLSLPSYFISYRLFEEKTIFTKQFIHDLNFTSK